MSLRAQNALIGMVFVVAVSALVIVLFGWWQ